MIPRLQARGTSFKGSCTYVLHDPKSKTHDRVAWILTQNLHSEPDQAWFEMYDTWRNQAQLKANAGLSARGRKNNAPVLHYTLAWHADDQPTAEQMREAAFASLKVLGLQEHEALIVAHDDKKHPHVHIVANTVHPYTGRTAELKYSKERLSEWAEAYEREHGIHCEERLKNNEQRRKIRQERSNERLIEEFSRVVTTTPSEKQPYIPIKDNSPNRPQWLDKKEIVDRMKRLRAELGLQHKQERSVTWQNQKAERDALDKNTYAAIANARSHVKEKYRPHWRDLYRAHTREQRFVSATHPLERAVFVFRNRERLSGGRPLTLTQIAGLILSKKRLSQALGHAQELERRALAREEKTVSKQLTDRIWLSHRERFHTMRDRQAVARQAEKAHQQLSRKDISFAHAKTELVREAERPLVLQYAPAQRSVSAGTTQEFNAASFAIPRELAPPSRAEQIRRDMEAWRRNNSQRDFGREL